MIGRRRAVTLVARREILVRGRERGFVVSTIFSLVLLAGIVLLPSALGLGGATKADVAAAGPAAERLVRQADRSPDVELTVKRASSDAAARAQVRDGDAAAALVPRQEDLQSVTAPLTIAMMIGFLLSFGALQDPESGLAQVLSFVPPAAPMVMPVRVIQGGAAAWEIVAAIVVTVVAVAALVVLAGRIYTRAVLQTGVRVRLAAVLGDGD